MTLFCQMCGTPNPEGREHCERCGVKLLVVSGEIEEPPELTEELFFQEQQELEEHILERITALEEGLRQIAHAVAHTAEKAAQVEHNLTVTHTGVEVLGQLLESHGVLPSTEFAEGWERTVDRELVSRDLARRFRERLPRILSHATHSGQADYHFRRQLRVLELALAGRQLDTVQDQLTELVTRAPSNDELWSFLGETAFETGDLEVAAVAFRRVLDLRGQHHETLIYLGTVLSDLGRFDEAEMYLREALEQEPASFLPSFTLGALDVVRGDHRVALEHLADALRVDEVPQAWYLTGVCHLALGRPGKAIAALRRAVELAPNFEEAVYQLGIAYLRRGWTRLALETFQQLADLDPRRLQYLETVRLLALEAPQDLPEEAGRLVQNAEAALERGRPAAALDLFARATELAPDHLSLHATAALLASSLGRTREAVAHAHRVLDDPPADSPYVAAAVVALLESLRNADRRLTARRLARRIHRTGPDRLSRAMAAYELALVESEIGTDLEEARDLAVEALEITPRELRHYPLAALGEIALKRGRFREAVQYLEQAIESAPRPALLRQLALARIALGDAEGAEEALEAATAQPGRDLDSELLGHVHRLGSLLGGLTRRSATMSNRSRGG